MLILARNASQLRFGSLMEIYTEGNRENGSDRYGDLPPEQALLQAEQDFYQYLREVFFPAEGAVYAIWEVGGRYVSALRLEPYRDGLLLEALETMPCERRRGYAQKLILGVLEQYSGTRIYSHVHKRNLPSLAVHEKCGFRRISEQAVYIDGSVNSRACTLCYE